jgi:hypothetical protein
MTNTAALPLPGQSSAYERSVASNTQAINASSGAAWQREMERAQIADWFQPATRATTAYTSPSATSASSTRTIVRLDTAYADNQYSSINPPGVDTVSPPSASAAQRGNPVSPAMQIETESTGERPAVATEAVTMTPAEKPMEVVLRVWAQCMDQAARGASIAATSSITRPPESSAIRLHVEHAVNSVSVWIGANPGDTIIAHQLPLLLDQLRRNLHAQGLRLASLTLNGRTVWQDHSFSSPVTSNWSQDDHQRN